MARRVPALLLLSAIAFAKAPCTTGTQECTEWLIFGQGPSRSLIYRTYPLDEVNERITRALVIVHGMNRNADHYFTSAVAAAFLAGALEDTVVIAPRFASRAGNGCQDALAQDEVSWPCDVWRSGGLGASEPKLTSFDLADELLRNLAAKRVFPNLKSIVFTGDSAGGQFTIRYAMGNIVHEKLGIPVTYVVSNPSSYPYLDPVRPVPGFGFVPYPDRRNCTTYDAWPYGIRNRSGYTAKMTEEQLKRQLASRPVIYLLGQLDTAPLAGFDSSCPAMAQGPTRRERGESWAKYVNSLLGARHQVIIVPMCGHNARCMYTDDVALPVLFPRL